MFPPPGSRRSHAKCIGLKWNASVAFWSDWVDTLQPLRVWWKSFANMTRAERVCATRPQSFPPAIAPKLLRASIGTERFRLPPALPASGAPAVSIAIVGAPLCASQWQLLKAIEAAGGRIVLNGTESGERSLLPQSPPTDWSCDPVGALADGYCEHSADVFQRPNTRLYDWLGRRLRERAARGLVLWSWFACDLWRAEAASLREAFGLPVLLLEADEAQGVSPRELGRLQAFIEMLR